LKGDRRKLSGRTDLTIVSPDGKHFKHYQTVDVDRNGNAKRIRRNLPILLSFLKNIQVFNFFESERDSKRLTAYEQLIIRKSCRAGELIR
jgi:hypothetical protein